jgi:hypothetical protein
MQVSVRVFAQVYQEVARNAKKGGGGNAKETVNKGAAAVRSKLSHQMPIEVRALRALLAVRPVRGALLATCVLRAGSRQSRFAGLECISNHPRIVSLWGDR